MSGTNFFTQIFGTNLEIALTDRQGLAVLAKCTGAIPTTANLFALNCFMVKQDSTGSTVGVYTNTGTSAVPVWSYVASGVKVFGDAPDTRTGAGAISLTTTKTLIVTTGANALTLADGVEGQVKFLVMKTDGGDGTLTPANLYNGTTITFNDVGDSAHLVFIDGQWVFMGGTATLA